jgi:hypothetical protein
LRLARKTPEQGGRMIRQENRRSWVPKTTELTLTAGLAAIYAITTFLPLSKFIGGPGFITLEIVMLPIIAALLRPLLASAAVLVGTLVAAPGQSSFTAAFGPFGPLIPLIAVATGSIAFHYRLGPIVPWVYVIAGAAYYVALSKGGTLFWLVPYFLVIISFPAIFRLRENPRIGLLSFFTAMAEQVTLNILSISYLGFTGAFWLGVTPLMYAERTLATIGGATGIVALKSGLGGRLDLMDRSPREVRQ